MTRYGPERNEVRFELRKIESEYAVVNVCLVFREHEQPLARAKLTERQMQLIIITKREGAVRTRDGFADAENQVKSARPRELQVLATKNFRTKCEADRNN